MNATIQFRLTEDEYRAAREEWRGFCIGCGSAQEDCDPSERNSECEVCGAAQVFGAIELLMMGRLAVE